MYLEFRDIKPLPDDEGIKKMSASNFVSEAKYNRFILSLKYFKI